MIYSTHGSVAGPFLPSKPARGRSGLVLHTGEYEDIKKMDEELSKVMPSAPCR